MPSPIDRRALLGAAVAGVTVAAAPRVQAEETNTKMPATPMPSLETYAESPFIDQISLSPNGKRCAVIMPKGDTNTLMVMTVGDPDSQKTTPLGKTKIRGLFWTDDGHVAIITSTTTQLFDFVGGKHEYEVVSVLDTETLKLCTLFSGDADFNGTVLGDLGRVKTASGYRITASNLRATTADHLMCLYSFPADGSHGSRLCEASRETEGWVIGPDGHVFAMSEFHEADKQWTLFYNVSTSDAIIFKPIYKTRSALNSPDLIGLGRDGKSVVIQLNEGFDNGRYHEVGADGALSDPLDAANEDKPRTPLFHPVTGRLSGFLRHDDWYTYDYFDPLMKKLQGAIQQTMGDDCRAMHVDFADDPRRMILYGEAVGDAGTYYFSDFSDGRLLALAANYPDLPPEWISQKQPIAYKAADGLDIHGYLTLPPFRTAKNLPLVVLPHGGPQARDDIGFDWQAQVLASRGYAVLQPNFRGSSGYGGGFVAAGHGEWGGKMQTDLSDGVRWLAGKGTVDPKRVAIMGASYGGYAAMAGATLDPGVYTCAVAVAGPSDIKAFIEFEIRNTNKKTDSGILYWKTFLGDEKRYDAISPAKQAAKASCPVLLIHGTDDTVVPIEQSRIMERALKAAGKPVEFITYKGQDHWETIPSTRIAMMRAAMEFLARHNPA